jgi:hypothetical protein
VLRTSILKDFAMTECRQEVFEFQDLQRQDRRPREGKRLRPGCVSWCCGGKAVARRLPRKECKPLALKRRTANPSLIAIQAQYLFSSHWLFAQKPVARYLFKLKAKPPFPARATAGRKSPLEPRGPPSSLRLAGEIERYWDGASIPPG